MKKILNKYCSLLIFALISSVSSYSQQIQIGIGANTTLARNMELWTNKSPLVERHFNIGLVFPNLFPKIHLDFSANYDIRKYKATTTVGEVNVSHGFAGINFQLGYQVFNDLSLQFGAYLARNLFNSISPLPRGVIRPFGNIDYGLSSSIYFTRLEPFIFFLQYTHGLSSMIRDYPIFDLYGNQISNFNGLQLSQITLGCKFILFK